MALTDCLPARPALEPLDWRGLADVFDRYVLDPGHGVAHTLPSGHVHFNAFLEGRGYELITYGALVLGKVLRDESVVTLLPSLADYFSEDAGVFLNGIEDDLCEYWYLMHVNALAWGVIRSRLMDDVPSVERLRRSADRLISLAHQIGYDFNDQGYHFGRREPFTNNDDFRQPDAIGGYAYLMLFAHEVFGDARYLDEALAGLGRYQEFEHNPWYEIPSGAMACLAAARLSARGHGANLDKILGFALDPDEGCLHTGRWGEAEVNGLMYGWRGHSRPEAASTAYSLESMVPLPYLLSVARYRPEYATDIGRYALNVVANLRWFFADHLRRDMQARPDLAPAVPYEALHRERGGKSPFAAGDFFSGRSVYGGAFALWLGELVRPTQDPFIPRFDTVSGDLLAQSAPPAYLLYNPWPDARPVALDTGELEHDLYDLGTRERLHRRIRGKATIELPAEGARVIELSPCD